MGRRAPPNTHPLFLAVHKLGRPRPREGKGKIAPRELYAMPLSRENASFVRNIEGQEGQQVARVGNILSAAVGRLKIESSD